MIAFISAVSYQRLGDIIPSLFEEGKVPFIVLLDGITDVRNFGAIARTCECTGVDAIVLPERGSVSVNADAVKLRRELCCISLFVGSARYIVLFVI